MSGEPPVATPVYCSPDAEGPVGAFVMSGNQGTSAMKKYLVATVLIVGFTSPVLAVETFYIMFDNSMKGQAGACSVMTSKPADAKYKAMGEYKSQAEAEAAMKTMKECG
jgi:hypothetical protein